MARRVLRERFLRDLSFLFALVIICLWLGLYIGSHFSHYNVTGMQEFSYNATHCPSNILPAPENTPLRYPDTIDTFAHYSYHNHTACQISSLDLHTPFSPLCTNRPTLLAALSGGGRIGFESPYIPRDCDMRWYTTSEICSIFSRFTRVIVVGDSMMRHLVGALNVLLRRDLGYGAVTNWNFSPEEFRDCFCNHQFDVKSCSLQGIFRTADVLQHDPSSFACDPNQNVDLVIEMMLRFPLVPEELTRYTSLLDESKPAKPYAFIFGHGLWNDLDLAATLHWLDGILASTISRAPYLSSSSSSSSTTFPRLFISPSAAGPTKPDQFIVSQGDKALQIFETSTRDEVVKRGIDHLGTWNMSIQANKYDGVHLDLRGNLIKAMAVVNWLAMVDVEEW